MANKFIYKIKESLKAIYLFKNWPTIVNLKLISHGMVKALLDMFMPTGDNFFYTYSGSEETE